MTKRYTRLILHVVPDLFGDMVVASSRTKPPKAGKISKLRPNQMLVWRRITVNNKLFEPVTPSSVRFTKGGERSLKAAISAREKGAAITELFPGVLELIVEL